MVGSGRSVPPRARGPGAAVSRLVRAEVRRVVRARRPRHCGGADTVHVTCVRAVTYRKRRVCFELQESSHVTSVVTRVAGPWAGRSNHVVT